MSAWRAADGSIYTTYTVSTHATEEGARAAAVGLGAVLVREKLAGSIYHATDGDGSIRVYRVERAAWRSSYDVIGTREVPQKESA